MDEFFSVSDGKNPENRKQFLIEFASKKGFDPLVPDTWKKIKRKEVIEQV